MKPCPFCGSVGSYTDECSPGTFRTICAVCDAFGPPASTPIDSADKWETRGQPPREMTATEIAAQAALNRTRNEAKILRKQAMIRHARAIIDLYDDGGVM